MKVIHRLLIPVCISATLLATPSAPAMAEECAHAAAAYHGSAHDQYLLGKSFVDGTCEHPVDRKQAVHWLTLGANGGDMLAQYTLAEHFFTGDGATPDYVAAKKWYLKAAAQGHGPSQLRLGFLYAEKHFPGVTPDLKQAETWFKKAALQDAGDAQFRLGNFYLNYKQPPEPALAREWLLKAAKGGHSTAMFDVGRLMLDGIGGDKAITEGLNWIIDAAEHDDRQAQLMLAEVYSDGKYIPADPVLALKWILQLASSAHATANDQNRAGDIFFSGWKTIPRNYPAARRWYEQAAMKDDPHARQQLGIMYRDGLGVEKDAAKADDYFRQSQKPQP